MLLPSFRFFGHMLSRCSLVGLIAAVGGHAGAIELKDVSDFASLDAYAAALAKQPYVAPVVTLHPFFDKLEYDGHRKIRFREEHALYAGDGSTYHLDFFHPGWMFKKTVGLFDMGDSQIAKPIPFDPALFNYHDLQLPADIRYPTGFTGFRVMAPNSLMNRRFEFMVFLGASYYRAATTELGFGVSARGVAVNTIGGEPEEFPDFTHFWFQKPAPSDKFFKVNVLLNGPSVTGAYAFEAMPGKTTEMFVKGTLYLRKPVKVLGIAPFSSMFWYGENTHPKPLDFRPEVHDSDGLQIEIEDGPSIWRPLDVSKDLRLSLMQTGKLKGFGLAERDRDFKNFEDLEAMYHRRPAVWVEPIRGFDKGTVTLVEIPTGEETWDNVVTFFQPEKIPASPAEPLHFEYRLSWLEEHFPGTLARVIATRRGLAMKSDDHLYVIDFAKGNITPPPAKGWIPTIDVAITGGDAKVLDQRVMFNPETSGWRAFFKLDVPEKTNLLEISCELKQDTRAISERWMYQWRR
jgi:periplasmic glucans biosynthesis protein